MDVEPGRDVVHEAIVAVRDAVEGSRLQVEDSILNQPQHADLVGDAGQVCREDHLRQQPGPAPIAVMVDEVAGGHIRRADPREVTQDRERGPGPRMQEEPRQPPGAPSEVEHAAAGERVFAHGKPRGADLRPRLGVGRVYEFRAALHRMTTEVTDGVDPPADTVAPLDHRHREPLPHELPRRRQARHSGADHQHVAQGFPPKTSPFGAGHGFCPRNFMSAFREPDTEGAAYQCVQPRKFVALERSAGRS